MVWNYNFSSQSIVESTSEEIHLAVAVGEMIFYIYTVVED
jgi:hypothetical protein